MSNKATIIKTEEELASILSDVDYMRYSLKNADIRSVHRENPDILNYFIEHSTDHEFLVLFKTLNKSSVLEIVSPDNIKRLLEYIIEIYDPNVDMTIYLTAISAIDVFDKISTYDDHVVELILKILSLSTLFEMHSFYLGGFYNNFIQYPNLKKIHNKLTLIDRDYASSGIEQRLNT